jgi:hypothetical protein
MATGQALALKLPLPTAHGAKWCGCLGIDPLQYAVKVVSMVARTPDERAVITRELTVRAAAVKRHPAYATRFILCIPRPGSHRMPLQDLDLHRVTFH